ncbi:MAG: hypothetical protein JNK09_04705 [Prolixibacteraceae bacterium]|jgi:hypothetical protein|nr:hypothetical protein [Prolixibacteraceae bacterium]
MPIEIKELNIKINVSEQSGSGGQNSSPEASRPTDDIVAQCVEQVLEIISKNRER